MPFAGYKNFDDCVNSFTNRKNPRTGKNYTVEEARKICATIERNSKKSG